MASVRERTSKSGETTYAVLYRLDGKQRSHTYRDRATADRLASLMDLLTPLEALRAMGEVDESDRVTVAALFDQWHDWKARDLTPRVAADYRRNYDNWIDPFFGHRDAASVTELDVQKWVDRDLARKLGPKTTADHHALLHGMYAWASARKRAIVPRNPCKETDLPKRKKAEAKGLTLPEWAALRESAYRLHPNSADLILFLASTGWRIGEATALMARGVDDDGDRVYASMTQVQRKGEGIVRGGKSIAAVRRVRMLPDCADMLRRRLVGLAPDDLVFGNPASPRGIWEPVTFRMGRWQSAVNEAGLQDRKPTPHWLRHTHVALCLAAGMSLPEIQRRLGHEDIQTTINVYGRMIDEMSDDVAERMDLLLAASAPRVVAGSVVPVELG